MVQDEQNRRYEHRKLSKGQHIRLRILDRLKPEKKSVLGVKEQYNEMETHVCKVSAQGVAFSSIGSKEGRREATSGFPQPNLGGLQEVVYVDNPFSSEILGKSPAFPVRVGR